MINRFFESMGLSPIPEEFRAVYKSALEEYKRSGTFFLKKEYILALNEETGAFPNIIAPLLEDAERIQNDSEAALYALFVYRAMQKRDVFLKNLRAFTFPEDKYFLLAFFTMMPTIREMRENLIARGVPLSIVTATARQFEDCVFIYEKRYDRLGFNKRYFNHMQHYVDTRILNIGRLRFEVITLHDPIYLLENKKTQKQTLLLGNGKMRGDGLYADTPPADSEGYFFADIQESETAYVATPISRMGRCEAVARTFPKSEWDLRVAPNDCCLSVHIPDKGALTEEACAESYRKALAIFKTCYPEHRIKAFHCHSWMLAPELSNILKKDSNILAFAQKYHRFPVHTQGEDVMNFVFYLKAKDYKDLPEDTSLQRALKKRYLSGEYLYEYGGLFTPETI